MRRALKILFIAAICLTFQRSVFATPSTQIWNPSTDIQALGTVHFGIDSYFTTAWPISNFGGTFFPTDVNLTYGLLPGAEFGIDSFLPSSNQFTFNAKYGIPESSILPALALGFFNFGFDTLDGVKSSDQNIVYSLMAKTFGIGRLSAGYYSGNRDVLVDEFGDPQSTGFIFTWDKTITDKIWACVDYASGYSVNGALFGGLSYAFAPNTSVIFGYGTFNNGHAPGASANPVVTTQLDINV